MPTRWGQLSRKAGGMPGRAPWSLTAGPVERAWTMPPHAHEATCVPYSSWDQIAALFPATLLSCLTFILRRLHGTQHCFSLVLTMAPSRASSLPLKMQTSGAQGAQKGNRKRMYQQLPPLFLFGSNVLPKRRLFSFSSLYFLFTD